MESCGINLLLSSFGPFLLQQPVVVLLQSLLNALWPHPRHSYASTFLSQSATAACWPHKPLQASVACTGLWVTFSSGRAGWSIAKQYGLQRNRLTLKNPVLRFAQTYTTSGIMWNYVELCGIRPYAHFLHSGYWHSLTIHTEEVSWPAYNCRMLSQRMPSGKFFYFFVQECDLANNHFRNTYVEFCGLMWNYVE